MVWFLVIGMQLTLATAGEIGLFIGIEAVAVLTEGVMYALLGKMGWKSGMTASSIANAASAMLGLVL